VYLDRVDYLLSVADGPQKAGVLLSEAIASYAAKVVDDSRLRIRWAEISQQIADALTLSSGDEVQALVTPLPISILRWALSALLCTTNAHTLILSSELRKGVTAINEIKN
jgi:hypothetical protein